MNNLINAIADVLNGLLTKWPGSKSYGIAETITRGTQTLPGVVKNDGEIAYVGPDDTAPVIIYHRLIGLASSIRPGGTGDSIGDLINNFTVAMIVYMDRKATGLTMPVMLQYIQANVPDALEAKPYKKIFVRFTGAVLNSQQIFRSEFANSEMKLPAEKTMFQINYTLETQTDKRCFASCPC